jgi:hypothetical protein
VTPPRALPSRIHAFRSPTPWAALFLIVSGAVSAGCSTTSHSSVQSPTTTVAAPTTTIPPTTTTTTEQPGWTPVSTVNGAIAVDTQSVTEATGHVVTVFRFRTGQTRFGLHVGSSDPPTGAATVFRDNGSSIGPDEAPTLVAAFNGGFKANSGAGGFELNGQVLIPLVAGTASLVIDTSGVARVGVWGRDLPAPGEQVSSVRQNLAALVIDGQPAAQIADIGAWGSTLGGGAAVARSSLGEDTAGNLVYAASMQAVPGDLAGALIGAGAVRGMQLDINPQWVQLATAPTPGAPLVAGIPGQNRPGNQYQVGWTRDFVTVLAAQ